MKNYISANDFIIKTIKKRIMSCDLDNALQLSCLLMMAFNKENVVDDFTDIEKHLVKIAFKEISINCKEKPECKDLFIITQAYSSGGHTRLMENLSNMLDNKSDLVITRKTNSNTVTRLKNYFNKVDCMFIEKGNKTNNISTLVNKILRYKKIVLNTHPDDIYSIVACGVAKKINSELKIYFVNHADHQSTYGASVADIWYEISLYGMDLDKVRGVKCDKSFLGIPINKEKNLFFNEVKYKSYKEKSLFLLAASSSKFESENNNNIGPLIKLILDLNPSNLVVVIGTNNDSLSFFYNLKEIYGDRISFYNSMPFDDYIKLTSSADFYIDSYPMPGGTAFVEQFIEGIACIGLNSRFYGYSPLELIKRDSVGEVVDVLKNPPTLDDINILQDMIYKIHGYSEVKNRFIKSLEYTDKFKYPISNFANRNSLVLKPSCLIFSRRFFKKIFLTDFNLFFKVVFSVVLIKYWLKR